MISNGSRYDDSSLSSEDERTDMAPSAVLAASIHVPTARAAAPASAVIAAHCPDPPSGDSLLDRLPSNVLNDISSTLLWMDVVRLSRCSRQMRHRQGEWVRYRMDRAADPKSVINALFGIVTLPEVQRSTALRDFSARMLTVTGSGDETVLKIWRKCLEANKTWLLHEEDTVRFAGATDLLIAGYRVVWPKDRIKPGWVVRRTLGYMLKLPVMHWPDVLTVLCDGGGHANEVAYCVKKFVRRFRGTLVGISDPFATAVAHALLFRVSTYDVPATLKRRFGVTNEQQDRIIGDIALVIGRTAAKVTIAEDGEGALDGRCGRWRGGEALQRLAEEHFVAAIGPDMRLDKSWATILLRGGAMSARVRVIAQNRIAAIESQTILALADDPNACERFLLLRESIGGIMRRHQWHHARSTLDTLPWQARPALMLRLVSRIAPLRSCELFDDEEALTILSDVAMWTARIVPRCLKHEQTGLAARALAATLSICSTFDGIDPSVSREIVAEVFECGLALLPPPEWGILLDSLCFASRRGAGGSIQAIKREALRSAVRAFICDPQSHFISPTPRFAKWLCREASLCWETLSDGGTPDRRWTAFCDRFDLSPDTRKALRLRVLASYARGLASKPESIAAVLSRAGFNDAQGLHDIENAVWRLHGHWPPYAPLEKRLALFGLTPRLRDRIEGPDLVYGPETYRILAAITR